MAKKGNPPLPHNLQIDADYKFKEGFWVEFTSAGDKDNARRIPPTSTNTADAPEDAGKDARV